MTGGSGKRTAVPLPRDPTMTDVALLPENKVLELEKAEERLLRFLLSAVDVLLPENDIGLDIERLLCVGVTPEDSAGFCKLCNCHICKVAFPDFSDLLEPLMDHVTFVLY